MQFGYTILYVPDVVASLAFYQAAFGLNTRFLHDSGDFAGVFAKALEISDHANFARRKKESRKQGKLRGIAVGSSPIYPALATLNFVPALALFPFAVLAVADLIGEAFDDSRFAQRPMLRGVARLRFKFTLTMAAYDLIRLPKLLGAAA